MVSHDKSLMDTLCSTCLFIDPPDYKLYPGTFSQGWQQVQRESKTAEKQELLARKEYKRIEREVKKRRAEAAAADRRKSKRGVDKKDHDAKAKTNLARLTGKDAVAGKLLNQLNGRARQAHDHLDSLAVKKSYETGIWQDGECSRRNALFILQPGEISLGDGRKVKHPKLEMKPADRIALVGANGIGKSTLIEKIIDDVTLPKEKITYLPQEIDQVRSAEILKEVKSLSSEKLGYVMTFVNRLGTRPPRLLESASPSPGEIRKILLALGASNVPHLMILDEPTNHLDLLSVDCLKDSLSGYPAGLLLVSHDDEFLNELTEIRWQITMNASNPGECILEVER
jgi:ATPase subunit of ABC transporter with duplicated ATPase domains